MKAMILAAGRGERMRPLSDTVPKPLLRAGGKPLIVWQIERLVAAGIPEIVINHAHLGPQIEAALGDGGAFGARIRYSPEPPGALGTAGGIAQALPLLGYAPFVAVNGDIWCDYDYSQAAEIAGQLARRARLAHLVLVANPAHHPGGDFALNFGEVSRQGTPALTFAGIGIYQRALFSGLPAGTEAELAPLLRAAMDAGQVSGEYHFGRWTDVGTPERLAALDAELSQEAGP
jgi:MurNAc alpha-1-phosphate uridylyltransferase